jgi:hypothetical protein
VVGRITDGAGTEDRRYGPLGEIVQETRAIPIQGKQVNTYTTKFQYDTWNRISTITYPDPSPQHQYNLLSRLACHSVPAGLSAIRL